MSLIIGVKVRPLILRKLALQGVELVMRKIQVEVDYEVQGAME